MRPEENGDDADRRVRILLGLPRLRCPAQTQTRRLLCLLFVRFGEMPTCAIRLRLPRRRLQHFTMTKELLRSEAMVRLGIFLGIFALMSLWE